MKMRFVSSLFVLVAATACSTSSPERAPLDEATRSSPEALRIATVRLGRESLLAADAALANAVSLRGVSALTEALTDDALLLVRRQPLLTGKQAIADFFAANPIVGTWGWRYARGDVGALGDLGYTFGWGEVIAPADAEGNVAVANTIYTLVWQRSLGSAWKVRALVRVDLPTAPAAPPAGFLPLASDGPVYPRGNAARAEAEMIQTDTEFAAYTDQVGQAQGFGAYVAEDGVNLDDPFQFGRAAVIAAREGVPPTDRLLWKPILATASAVGDLGFTVGGYTYERAQPDGSTLRSYGKYLTVWKRQQDGRWKYVLDGGGSSPTPVN